MAGPRRLSRARPEVSFPGDPLGETQALPGGTGRAAREPLPLGLPIGRRDAAGEPEPGLVSRQVGGGAPTPGSGDDPGGGSRAARAPETVTFRFGAGGMRLPKATPRIGGGGGTASVLATGPSTREADEVPVSPRPGVGPGQGGGAGAGIGGGLGYSRGRGIGVAAGAHDLAVTRRRPGAGIGAASGSGVGASGPGSGRQASAELPGTGGRRGAGDGSGSGLGTGSGRGIAKARPGLEGIPFGDPGGTPAGGNPAGGGGKGGGPGGPGHGIQMARRGTGSGGGDGGEDGAGIWPGRGAGSGGIGAGAGAGKGAGGSGTGPGTGTGKGSGAGTHPGSGSGARGGGGELPGKSGGKAAKPGLPRYTKAVPGLEEWDEEVLGRGFYPDGIMGYYYDDPDQTVDHANPESYLNTPIPEGATFTRLVAKRKDKRIDFNWNPAGEWGDWSKLLNPLPGINNVYWSARWIGQLFVPKDDVYTFKFDPLDDGGRLYLRYRPGGPLVKVIDAWRVSSTRPETRPHRMQRGAYDIQVEYAQRPEFYAAISLKWKSSSFDWEVIGPYRSGGSRRAR
ncbi:MAG TPA: PA14 domain-containing protein [Armatimonadota bacterium]|nr:PA14 domain-containing protein [Armatimonadota bacterium]